MVEKMEGELGEFFEMGKEIVGYAGKEDLLRKIRHYLAFREQRGKDSSCEGLCCGQIRIILGGSGFRWRSA